MRNLLLSLGVLVAANAAFAVQYKGDVYEQNSGKQKKLYTFEFVGSDTDTPTGKIERGEATFKDLQGNVVFYEAADLKETTVIKTSIEQRQTNQKATIEVKDGMIYFSKTVDGKETVEKEKLKLPFVISASFQRHVRAHWDELMAGKTLEFRYGVWDRQETVGFEIFKEKMEDVSGKQAMVLKMKPSSFVIAALVKPIFFKFDTESKNLLEMNGRVAPKNKDGEKWKDLDAEVVYSY